MTIQTTISPAALLACPLDPEDTGTAARAALLCLSQTEAQTIDALASAYEACFGKAVQASTLHNALLALGKQRGLGYTYERPAPKCDTGLYTARLTSKGLHGEGTNAYSARCFVCSDTVEPWQGTRQQDPTKARKAKGRWRVYCSDCKALPSGNSPSAQANAASTNTAVGESTNTQAPDATVQASPSSQPHDASSEAEDKANEATKAANEANTQADAAEQEAEAATAKANEAAEASADATEAATKATASSADATQAATEASDEAGTAAAAAIEATAKAEATAADAADAAAEAKADAKAEAADAAAAGDFDAMREALAKADAAEADAAEATAKAEQEATEAQDKADAARTEAAKAEQEAAQANEAADKANTKADAAAAAEAQAEAASDEANAKADEANEAAAKAEQEATEAQQAAEAAQPANKMSRPQQWAEYVVRQLAPAIVRLRQHAKQDPFSGVAALSFSGPRTLLNGIQASVLDGLTPRHALEACMIGALPEDARTEARRLLGQAHSSSEASETYAKVRKAPSNPVASYQPHPELWAHCALALSASTPRHVYVWGAPGLGKTVLADALAQATNRKLFRHSVTPETESYDFEGTYTAGPAGTKWIDSILLQAVRAAHNGQRVLLLLDELDAGGRGLHRLHDLLATGRYSVPATGESFDTQGRMAVLANGNTLGDGGSIAFEHTQALNTALRSRFVGGVIEAPEFTSTGLASIMLAGL